MFIKFTVGALQWPLEKLNPGQFGHQISLLEKLLSSQNYLLTINYYVTTSKSKLKRISMKRKRRRVVVLRIWVTARKRKLTLMLVT